MICRTFFTAITFLAILFGQVLFSRAVELCAGASTVAVVAAVAIATDSGLKAGKHMCKVRAVTMGAGGFVFGNAFAGADNSSTKGLTVEIPVKIAGWQRLPLAEFTSQVLSTAVSAVVLSELSVACQLACCSEH